MPIHRTYTNTPWEKQVGYCRAVRHSDLIYVTGTAPVEPDGSTHAPGDAYAQSKRCLELIRAALAKLTNEDERAVILRTRMFVTDIARWEECGRAHGEVFKEAPPATTMVEVKALISPDMLIEIEADAAIIAESEHAPKT
jgi:isochorismate pyruvate lyase